VILFFGDKAPRTDGMPRSSSSSSSGRRNGRRASTKENGRDRGRRGGARKLARESSSSSSRQRRSKWSSQNKVLALPRRPQETTDIYAVQQQVVSGARAPDQLMQVYVGNLDSFLGEAEIMQIFSAFGTVVSIDMPREGTPPTSKGYAFVEYTELSMADKAIASMQDFILAGRRLKVRTRTSLRRSGTVQGPVRGSLPLPPLMSPTSGGRSAATTPQLMDREVASGMDALTATTAAAGGDTAKLMERRRIVITGIPREFEPKDVKMVFQAFGMVRSCELLPSMIEPRLHCGTGIIEFATESAAKEAVQAMHNSRLGGSLLQVQRGSTVMSSGAVEPAPPMARGTDVGQVVAAAAAEPRGLQLQSHSAKIGAASRVLLLENLVARGEVDADLEEEVRGECGRFGKVVQVRVHEGKGSEDVRVFVRFTEKEACSKAQTAMHNRWFGGRQVRAAAYDEDSFLEGELDEAIPSASG